MGAGIRFPVAGDAVCIQTHTSVVYLVGDEVFKLKKPVRFSFLDYSTPDLRRGFCEKEVRLNRRFSPAVYLGVLPVSREADGTLVVGGAGDPVDWAVRMRRLPGEAMLARRLDAGDVRAAEIEALADLLAAFYAGADRGGEVARFGRLEQVRENTSENFETTMDFPEGLLPDALRRELIESDRRFLSQREALFAGRVLDGRIVDGHGDLKPENVFLPEGGPVVTDCIEFNDRFRYGDSLCDVAYLTMGLLAAGRPDLREAFLSRYRRSAEPDLPEDLLRFYETYRAVVKGKIEGYRARQPEVPGPEREEAARAARAHFELAGALVRAGRNSAPGAGNSAPL